MENKNVNNGTASVKGSNPTKKDTPAKEQLVQLDEGTIAMLKSMGVEGNGNKFLTAVQAAKLAQMQNAAMYAANTSLIGKACQELHTDHESIMDLIVKGAENTKEYSNKVIRETNKAIKELDKPPVEKTGRIVAIIAGLTAGIVSYICTKDLMRSITLGGAACAFTIMICAVWGGKKEKEGEEDE